MERAMSSFGCSIDAYELARSRKMLGATTWQGGESWPGPAATTDVAHGVAESYKELGGTSCVSSCPIDGAVLSSTPFSEALRSQTEGGHI